MQRVENYIFNQGTGIQRIVFEFFSMVSFEANIVDPHFATAFVFHLGVQYRECSLVEFAWRMGLYEQHQAMSPNFNRFLRLVTRDYSQGVNGYGFWTTIANGGFHSWVSQESKIRLPSIISSIAL